MDFEKISKDVPRRLNAYNFITASVEKVLDCKTGDVKTYIDYLGGDGFSRIKPLSKEIYDSDVKIFSMNYADM